MATISSTGLGSGINVEAVVTQLMSVEKRPLNLLQQANSTLNTRLSAVGKLTSYTSEMRDAANALSSVLLWKQTAATSSDSAAVGVSSAGGAVAGSYAIGVQQLASTQTVASQRFAASDTVVGTGTLKIELGSWTGEPTPTGFSAKSEVTVTIGEEDNTLEKIRDKINAAGAGVTATIVTDSQGARLALRSASTGAESAFRVTATETADDGSTTTGLSTLGFSAVGASAMTRTQTAADAVATINGIQVTSASNKLENVAEGLTLTLNKTTTSAVEVKVNADDEAVTKAVDTFVKAFNQLASYIAEQTKYDADTKKGGTLQGDRTTVSLQSQLRNVINEGSSASSVYGRLSDVGISMGANGQLSVDSTKLKNALTSQREELRKVFAEDADTTAGSGFMDRFRDLGNAVLGSEGLLTTRTSGIQSQIQQNEKSQDAFEVRLALAEARLRRQYQALDTSMTTLSGLSSYVTQQLAALNKSSS
ncbi:flagellar filament capping protein FliD [Rubrivivax sp. JA1024]|nr:flagellar filament capping protein FliD [Rubrivivax sp. JA1024]